MTSRLPYKYAVPLMVMPLMLLCVLGCSHDSAPAPSAAAASQTPAASAPPALDAEPAGPALHIDAGHAMQYTKEIVAIGPRWVGGSGQQKMAAWLRGKLKADTVEEDAFEAETPAGKKPMRNFIVRFQGTKEGVILLGSHIDTNYTLRKTSYAGANDGASSTGLLLAIADQMRGKKLEGFSVWLAFFDGEEAIDKWTKTDSIYGSRHLAEKWRKDGTNGKIRAFLLADMIGDADLNVEREQFSTPWLSSLLMKAATRLGQQSHFSGREISIEDDHIPFVQLNVPSVDIIDMDYGYHDSWHHTPDDTLDKLSPRSLQITGDVILELIRLLNANGDKLPASTPASGLPA